MEFPDYGGMNIPPNIQDQGMYSDCRQLKDNSILGFRN